MDWNIPVLGMYQNCSKKKVTINQNCGQTSDRTWL